MSEVDGLKQPDKFGREETIVTHVPIIALTAHSMRDYRRKCLESGVDDYLTKPIPRDDLSAAIEKNFGRRT